MDIKEILKRIKELSREMIDIDPYIDSTNYEELIDEFDELLEKIKDYQTKTKE